MIGVTKFRNGVYCLKVSQVLYSHGCSKSSSFIRKVVCIVCGCTDKILIICYPMCKAFVSYFRVVINSASTNFVVLKLSIVIFFTDNTFFRTVL